MQEYPNKTPLIVKSLIDAANRIEKDTLVESNEPMCRVGQMYEQGIGVEKNI